jgi:transforming growth factor-beta-induced protein
MHELTVKTQWLIQEVKRKMSTIRKTNRMNIRGLSKMLYALAAIVIILVGVGAGVYYWWSTNQSTDIVDTAKANGSFTTLVQALTAANLVDTLKGTGPFTVFAPTDAAFNALPSGLLNALLANTTDLTKVLTYHVVSGRLMATDVVNRTSVTTLQGGALPIKTTAGVKIGPATVTQTDIVCKNGVIHVIDKVLVPGNIMNIVQTAQYYGFSTLVTAVQTANLVNTLIGTGPFTVFAPTNAAFAALPAGVLDSLLANQTALTNVLTYHVVSGKLMAADVIMNATLTTVQGGDLTITTTGGVKVNSANVIQTDIECSNGVIHVIDAVLIPP